MVLKSGSVTLEHGSMILFVWSIFLFGMFGFFEGGLLFFNA